MKRSFALIPAVCLLFAVTSCAARTNVVSPDDDIPTGVPAVTAPVADGTSSEGTDPDSVTTEADEKYSLKGCGGWWKHVGGTAAMTDPFVDAFYIDEEAGTWREYSLSGIPGGTYACYADELGIVLEYGDVGKTILTFDGVSLLNAMGYIEYVPTDPIEEVSVSAYEGNWYEAGDKDGRCLTFAGDTYTLDQISGNWVSETVATPVDGIVVEEIRIKLTDRPGVELVVAEAGEVLFDPETKVAFIREKIIGKAEGDDYTRKYDLICGKWQAEGKDMPEVEFGYYGNKLYLINTVNVDGEEQIIRDVCGTWGIHNYELSIHYADGHEEITPYDPERLVFSYYSGMVINRVDTDNAQAVTG